MGDAPDDESDGATDAAVSPAQRSAEAADEVEDAGDAEGDGDAAADESTPDTAADGGPPLGVAIVTVSESRSLDEDGPSAEAIDVLDAAGHEIAIRERVGKDHDTVQATVSRFVDRDDVDFVVTTGATSVEPNDVTLGAVRPLLDDELTAFGTLFTQLAYEEIGVHVVAGRTLCGVADGVPVFCLPGNVNATRLAVEEIVSPVVRHLVELATPDEAPEEEA